MKGRRTKRAGVIMGRAGVEAVAREVWGVYVVLLILWQAVSVRL